MKLFICLIMLNTLFSCSNLSKNMVKEGTFTIQNGTYRNVNWSGELTLKRVSWYHEMTLLYDVMYGEIGESSKFYNWFSPREQKRMKKCSQVIVSINYALDTDRISHTMYKSKMRKQGFEEILVPQFSKSLRMHPDFKRLSLTLYKTKVYCREANNNTPVYMDFPNYKEVKLQ